MTSFLTFELGRYLKKPFFYLPLLLTLCLGLFIGARLSFSAGPYVSATSPYAITQLIGLLSLSTIFFTTLFGAQILFREHDSGFSLLLYSTPLNVTTYLWSRLLCIFLLSLLFLALLITGLGIGQHLFSQHANQTPFQLRYYAHPFFWLATLNTFFCTAIVCTVAWLSRNKLMVYSAGLLLYIIYIIMLLYSGSPLMAGALPPSAESMARSALLDPFGLSAFYHQSINWSVTERNHLLFGLQGRMLVNRLSAFSLAITLLFLCWRRFRFRINTPALRVKNEAPFPATVTSSPLMHSRSRYPTYNALCSYVKTDLQFIIKSIPFLVISLLMIFYLSVELYSDLDQGIRLPEHYATSGKMVYRIISTFHGMFLLVLLFYTQELYHRSATLRFQLIEHSTPHGARVFLTAKWCSLSALILLFTLFMIATGITFQVLYHYPAIQWQVYAAVFLFNSLPLILTAGLLLILHHLIPNRYVALAVSGAFTLATASGFSRLLGLHHPLLRFQTAYQGYYSDLNGWGPYLEAFAWKMAFGLTLTLLLFQLTQNGRALFKSPRGLSLGILLLSCTLFLGQAIHSAWHPVSEQEQMDEQAAYEKHYKHYQHKPQPLVTHIQTSIHLFPEWNAYQIAGTYTLQNKSDTSIEHILFNGHDELTIVYAQLRTPHETLTITHHTQELHLKKPLRPAETITLQFKLAYQWNGFNGHKSFNAIIGNGSFMRLSNYFPRIGYQADYELEETNERQKRGLQAQAPLDDAENAPRRLNDFIYLDAVVSTAPDQTVIGCGELKKSWTQHQRRCFHFQTPEPIPFRFGFASGRYAVQSMQHKGRNINVYYHPTHSENVAYLLQNAKATLAYAEEQFGPYPYTRLSFAEISGFTDGFNATAYPGSIFMNERMAFHCNIKADRGQDVINELAGHEVAHQWWGNQQIHPAESPGAVMLTESFAMYTELMLLKKMHGTRYIASHLNLHESMYLNNRGYSPEPPLYKTGHNDVYLSYSKGLLSMYHLYRLLGEENVNHLLKTFLLNYRWPSVAPVSRDFLNLLYSQTEPTQHPLIKEWFEEVVTYALHIKPVTIRQNANSFSATVALKLQRFLEDGKGQQQETPFNGHITCRFRFKNGSTQTVRLKLRNNSVDTTLLLPQRPLELIPDPEYDLLLRKREATVLMSGY
ncbi:MAG: M1 family aminopeptidase [Sediminibacterium sp.]|nr:M1 family aminopeptidase [Sediminibacterium sp.]